MYYTFLPPVSPRVFTVLQVTHLSESAPRTGYFFFLPIYYKNIHRLLAIMSTELEPTGTYFFFSFIIHISMLFGQ